MMRNKNLINLTKQIKQRFLIKKLKIDKQSNN